MSTESLSHTDADFFAWNDALDRADYVFATYYAETAVQPELAALAMAKEQTATTVRIQDHRIHQAMAARVFKVETTGETLACILPQYWLQTHSYPDIGKKDKRFWQTQITIAFPLLNLNNSLTHLWNVVVGELPRLGYINAIRLTGIDLPEAFLRHFPGPRYGMPGIREISTVRGRPLFCRSCRPAVGLDIESMCAINEQVLRGGFDAVKDDELTVDTPSLPYADRVRALAQTTRRVEQETGERKLYFANIIDDLSKSFEQLQIAEDAGADGVIVAPAIQGLAIAGEIARRTELPIIAHITVEDIFCRHPHFGVSPAVYIRLLRLSGADLVFPPGNFGAAGADRNEMQEVIAAGSQAFGNLRPVCPIICGGKQPDKLADYVADIGSPDFMIIAASSVDTHAQGMEEGARAFRTAWDRLDY